MICRLPVVVLFCLLPFSFLVSTAAAQPAPQRAPLRVVSAGPTGEVRAGEEGNEIRVVFSEPMVALARTPSRLKPAFFQITPAVTGSYRWSGTTILILTPAKRLPRATKYDVTIAAGATAVSGRKLAAPYTFSFMTQTAHLLQTHWYRPGGRFDAAPIIVLRFNQPVKPEDVAAHVRATFEKHDFTPPVIPAAAQARLRAIDPAALQAFTNKVQRARAAAEATAPVSLAIAKDWDKKRFKPSADMVVLQATTPVPPDSWVRLETDGRIPSLAGLATSGRTQTHTIEVEPTFLIGRFRCEQACDPENHNPLNLRVPVKADKFAAALKVTDVTDARRERLLTKARPRQRESWEMDHGDELSLEDAGFPAQPPATTFLAVLPADLQAQDGQVLGYTWAGQVENWHAGAFTSFGDGHGVWEQGGGALLPFHSRNFPAVRQWVTPVDPLQLMPTLLQLQDSNFRVAPPGAPVPRRLNVTPDRIQSHGLDLTGVLKPSGTGLVWTAIEEGTPIARSRASRTRDDKPIIRSSLVQVTNLGISIKDSPQNTLVFVTRLDNAAPVAGARVSIVVRDGKAVWTGTTGADGVAIAPQTRLRDPRRWSEFAFIVTAEKDGDVAYAGSDWNDGVLPWEYGLNLDLEEADPLLRGTVFTDRGVYKLGEEVHFKAILRSNTPGGIRLLPDGTAVFVSVRDSRDKVVDERSIKVNAWSTAEWTLTVPPEGALGSYFVRAILESDRKKTPAQETGPEEREDRDYAEAKKSVTGSFLVAAYRRPDFRVDVTLTGDSRIAGDQLKGVVTARYLFGAPMGKRPTHWALTRIPVYSAPAAMTEKFPSERWTFVGYPDEETRASQREMAAADAPLTAAGQLALTLDTEAKAGVPYSYTLEGDVEDVSRQHIANRDERSRPPGAVVHRRQADAALRRAARRPEDRARRRRPRRRAGARRQDRRHAHPGPVDERAARGGQRLLRLGDGAQGSAVGRMAPDERARPGAR